MDADFSWKSHVEAITSKATQNLFSKAMACGHSQPQLLHLCTRVIRPIGMFGITWSRELKWTKSKLSKDRSSAVAEMGDHGHNRHGPKRGSCCAPFSESWNPVLIQCGLGRGLLLYQVESSSIQPFGHNRHGPKTGAVPLLGKGSCDPI